MSIRMIIGLSGVLLVVPMTAIQAAEIPNRFSLEVEPAFAWQGSNDVQIPKPFRRHERLTQPASSIPGAVQ